MVAESRIQELEHRLSKSVNAAANSAASRDSPTSKSVESGPSDATITDLKARLIQTEKVSSADGFV